MLCYSASLPLKNSPNYNGPRVILVRPGQYDPNKMSIIDSMQVNHMISCIQLMEDDQSVIAGQLFIIDLSNVTLGHFTQMTPSVVKKMVISGQVIYEINNCKTANDKFLVKII